MPCVLHNKEYADLAGHCQERGKGNTGCEAKILSHWMKEPGFIRVRFSEGTNLKVVPNLRKFDREMGDEHKFGAVPLFLGSRYFLLDDDISMINIKAVDMLGHPHSVSCIY